jgi:hypothetical protein
MVETHTSVQRVQPLGIQSELLAVVVALVALELAQVTATE